MPAQDGKFYVSMKGVIINGAKALLVRKPSGGWDLPGGRLAIGEKPKQCLVREVREETGLIVQPKQLLHRWVRRRAIKGDVFLISHLCLISGSPPIVQLSPEHEEYGWFLAPEIAGLTTSKGVRASLRRGLARVK